MERYKNKEKWLFLFPTTYDVYNNINFEKKLFDAVENFSSPNIFRFWINQPSAIIGISQDPLKEVYYNICKKCDIGVAKRFTGGGTVYNDLGNLNWTYIVQKGSTDIENFNALNMYKHFSYPIIEFLKEENLDVFFKSPASIYLKNKKISGIAMGIKRNSVLCHGTLLINSDLKILESVLRNLKEPVTNVNYHVKTKLSKKYFMKKIIEKVKNRFFIKEYI
jgi:lipoate-protein ligase A